MFKNTLTLLSVAGAVAFAIGWAALEQVGTLYVAKVVARATALYGAIGAIFGLLAFLYAALWLFLLAAELSQAMRERDAGPRAYGRDGGADA